MHALSILIAVDQADELLLIKNSLLQKKVKNDGIQEAGTLQDALSLLDTYDFDVVLAGLFLPDSKGLNTIRQLHRASPQSAIIVISDDMDEGVALQCVRLGAQDYIEWKNISPSFLCKSITHSVERVAILQSKEDLLNGLTLALEHINRLETVLNACVSCKKIQTAEKSWIHIDELYQRTIQTNSGSTVCPECTANFAAKIKHPSKKRQ
ncbi:response regulator [Desulfogranum japonicum]|uniref:response regulator n=1 Tax=Desulfogranum japonicum TaxID=231447 RepID=UPI00041D07CE|nr:response regulator [Desulfogranum japonicum]